MVAMSVLAVGLTGMMALLNQSIGLNREVANDFTGTYLAAEGIEVAKNLLQGNFIRQLRGDPVVWDEGFSDGVYEIDYATQSLPSPLSPIATPQTLSYDPSTNLFSYFAGSGTQATSFTREVALTRMNADEIRVVARVAWRARGGGVAETVLEDHFYNWVGVPTP